MTFLRHVILYSLMSAVLLMRIPASMADEPCAELIMFEASYCEWCERWHEEIGGAYPNTSEGKAAPLRRVNIHDKYPEDLKAIKGVTYTPTFVLVQKGQEIGRMPGYIGQNFFWPLLQEMFVKAGLKSGNGYCAP